jgi:spectinomycin phosphotransferase
MHSAVLPNRFMRLVRRESFASRWIALVRELQTRVREDRYEDPFQEELASFWKARSEEIQRIVDRTEELGYLLQQRAFEFVLCHSDIHTANVLVGREGRLYIVDWDELTLAPRERDLMFVIGGAVAGVRVRPVEEAAFFEGYGKVDIDPHALAYYRYEWVVADIGAFGESVFLMDDVGEATKRDAVRAVIGMFQPGNVVEAAYGSEGCIQARDL